MNLFVFSEECGPSGGPDFVIAMSTPAADIDVVMKKFNEEKWPCQEAYCIREQSSQGNYHYRAGLSDG